MNPCWCYGPWHDVDPGDRPDTTLGRQHEQGSAGCEYPLPRREHDDFLVPASDTSLGDRDEYPRALLDHEAGA